MEKMDEQEYAELQLESQAVVGELLKTYMTPDKCIDAFIRWVLPMWEQFWGRFQSDGTLCWSEFEQFVQWEQRWQGDARRVFAIFDPNSTGYISKPFVLETRRKWQNFKDTASSNVDNFKWKFAGRWGTIGRGWRLTLDTTDTGHCPQLTFMRCCHLIGLNRNMKTLWRKLTKGDVSRSIVLRDLDPELDKILKEFALRLVTLHSTLRQGWCAICRAGGGHLHENGFEQACIGLGMDTSSSKLLFAVLDPSQRRYLTEYDNLDFLEIWNPGNQSGAAAAAAAAAVAMADPTSQKPGATGRLSISASPNILADIGQSIPNLGHFEFELVLSREEYTEYLRRRRGSRIRACLQGQRIDVGAESKRKPPPGGHKPRPPSAPARLRSGVGRHGTGSQLTLSLHEATAPKGDLWHSLAPNTLGTGKESLATTAQSDCRQRPSSLGRLLSCPQTTG